MQSNSSPPFPLIPLVLFNGGQLSEGGFELSRFLFLGSLLFSQGGDDGMDLSKVGEKILSSVRSARSLGLLPSSSDRPEVPERAAAAAALARVLAGLPPHQRYTLSSSSEELSSIYGSKPPGQVVEELEEEFYEEEFDPVGHILEHMPSEESELAYLEDQATLRLSQLDRISERLSRHVMEHHEVMVKGMDLVRQLERDLKIANVICMNGRRYLTSSRNEVSRDLIVSNNSKRKQALLDVLPVLTELRHALNMQSTLETLVEEGRFSKAFQVLSEYLQLLDTLSELSAAQEMSRGVEVWLGKTLQKLDSLLLGVCQDFKEENYVTVVDAYALIGDVAGLAEKIQSFFMQEVLSETHSALKTTVQEDLDNNNVHSSRLTYSDLCTQIPESKFRQCLLATLAVLFRLMCSYHAIQSFQPEDKEDISSPSTERAPTLASVEDPPTTSVASSDTAMHGSSNINYRVEEARDDGSTASSSGSPWFQLRKDATTFVSHTLLRGRKNLWQLTTSRAAVLLSSPAIHSASIHQFLITYEDLNIFVLAGEAFCGSEAVEFRQKVKSVCESYLAAFHRQNIHALKMVLEREHWLILPPETIEVVSFAGLVGDGAALIVSSETSPNTRLLQVRKPVHPIQTKSSKRNGFSSWLKGGNPFLPKLNGSSREYLESCLPNGSAMQESGNSNEDSLDKSSLRNSDVIHVNGNTNLSEDENEDLHADFIDEDSQLPSRISKPGHSRSRSSHWSNEQIKEQTGSSLSLLRSLDKYARLMQKLEIVNVEFFKGFCQLFGIFFHFVFETFGQQSIHPSGKAVTDTLSHRLKTALLRITHDCDQWMKPQSQSFSSSSPSSSSTSFSHMDVTPTSPRSYLTGASLGLKERCAGADTIYVVARLLHRSKAHLQSMLQNNAALVEDFYVHLVDAVPDLVDHIHRTTARLLLHINGYVDRIANAKWEVKELGVEHNGYVDLLLGEFKHYKTRLAHGGIQKEVQDLLLEYGVDNVAEILVEGLSRVKRCTDEGRALMSLDLQVLINGLKHFISVDVRPKLQIVETFIKAYYLPETEFVHWSRAHPEYSKSQIVGLINLVSTMKGWKRKTRLEILEKIE
ncbi:syndetin isoform X1 [Solanum tuberosum]|uniref:syndetin isoform X1 n=1 Tax=Solanum tuberosum TaxID=4113 RepID=UPI0003D25772|nr:PREDICTED: syndetin isoform X1 [Solanum tuberosum]